MNTTTEITASNPTTFKSRIYFVLKLVVAVSLLIYLFSYVGFEDLLRTLKNSNIYFLLISFLLLIPNIWLQYWKWELTCSQLVDEKNKRKVLLSLFYGFPAAVFTPARAGEYFGRGLAFKNKRLSEIILATAVDKFFTIVVTFIFGGIGMIIYLCNYYQLNIYLSIFLIFIFCALAIVIIKFILLEKKWFFKFILSISKFESFSKIVEILSILKHLNRKYFDKMALISSAFFLCYLVQFVILFIAFSHHLYLGNFFLAAVLIMFTKAVLSPLSISELGVREGASVYFLTKIGEPSSVALNASLALFAINILIPSAVGIILLFVKNDD
jgi:uncharacterized protein (TIRG00374 family)